MTSLAVLCSSRSIPASQKEYFFSEVNSFLFKMSDKHTAAPIYLEQVMRLRGPDSVNYEDKGSLRSALLKHTITCFREGNIEEAKTGLSVLIAMYFDYEYINREKWFEYAIRGVEDSPLDHRIYLCSVACMFDVETIPTMKEWSSDRILAFIAEG